MPSHAVIFTKRATSIVASGEEILLPYADFDTKVDYEGEIGVIVGKAGFGIRVEEAMDHVWGYTIVSFLNFCRGFGWTTRELMKSYQINDVTARERQRDHKQFYIGKSPDTFCPMVRMSQQFRGLNLNSYLGTNCSTSSCTPESSPYPDLCQWRRETKCYNRRLDIFHSCPDQNTIRRTNAATW